MKNFGSHFESILGDTELQIFQSNFPRDSIFATLTKRQFEVVRLVSEGHSTTEIAHKLRLKQNSVSNVIGAVYEPFGFPETVNQRVMLVKMFMNMSGTDAQTETHLCVGSQAELIYRLKALDTKFSKLAKKLLRIQYLG